MGHKLLTQLILITTAVAILLTYVKPAFEDIAQVQDDIIRYEDTIEKAAELNNELRSLVATEQNISNGEKQKLATYLPNQIDEVVIMRDIQNIFDSSNVEIAGLSAQSDESNLLPMAGFVEGSGVDLEETENQAVLQYQDFQASFAGSYQQLKDTLARLEANAYPLEVVTLSFSSNDAAEGEEQSVQVSNLPPDAMIYDLVLRAFALPGSNN